MMTGRDINLGKFFELASSKQIYANSLNLNEIKSEVSVDFTGDFES